MQVDKQPAVKMKSLEQKYHELSILNTIAEGLNRELNIKVALDKALTNIIDLFELETGWIWLLDEDTMRPYLIASLNLPPALENNPEKMEGFCLCLESFVNEKMDEPVNISAMKCSRLKKLNEGTAGLQFHTSVPIVAHGNKLGMLNVASDKISEIASDEIQLLHTIGDMIALAVERAFLYEKSKESGAVLERNRIARDLHDTISQGLAGIILHLETADSLIEDGQKNKKINSIIHQTLEIARGNLEDARRTVQDLRAAPLEGKSLFQAVKDITESKNSLINSTTYNFVGEMLPIAPRLEIGIFRIIQEALNNTLQHSGATEIGIDLINTVDQISLIFWDNGKGFSQDQIIDNQFGLIGINERVKLLDGEIKILSGANSGTQIEITLPNNINEEN